jgi:hypothetical protein
MKKSKSKSESALVDVITFTEAAWGLNVKLWPAQKVILKCLYGIPLSKNDMVSVRDVLGETVKFTLSEVDFLKYLYDEFLCNIGKVEEGKEYGEMLFFSGRRGTKTVISSIIGGYESYRLVKCPNPQRKYGLYDGAEIAIMLVAPQNRQAQICYDQIASFVKVTPVLRDRVVSMTKESGFKLASDADVMVDTRTGNIVCFPVGSNSRALRGHNPIVVILDEIGFMKSTSGYVTDAYLELALPTSRFNGDGKVILLASQDVIGSHAHVVYLNSLRNPQDTLMFKLYSTMVNPDINASTMRSSLKRNPTRFMGEFGAEFISDPDAWMKTMGIAKQAKGKKK